MVLVGLVVRKGSRTRGWNRRWGEGRRGKRMGGMGGQGKGGEGRVVQKIIFMSFWPPLARILVCSGAPDVT